MNTIISDTLDKARRKSRPGDILWSIRSGDGSLDLTYGDPEKPFFIASATKLYVTAILAQLRAEGMLNWDEPLASTLNELPIRELIGDATVREVMAHTSGLGDYFEAARADGPSTFQQVLKGDFGWTVNEVINWTRSVPRGRRGTGLYSDTGYQLLGALIEALDHRTFAQSVHDRVVAPLGLRKTYVFSLDTLDRYDSVAALFNGNSRLRIPQAMASVQADGGIVSTLADGQTFLRAFFDGHLFPKEFMAEIARDWHAIFRPLEYGNGLMRFQLPRLFTGFRRLTPFFGHSGASGTVMFQNPGLDLTIVGTINQIRVRSLPYRLMVRTVLQAGK